MLTAGSRCAPPRHEVTPERRVDPAGRRLRALRIEVRVHPERDPEIAVAEDARDDPEILPGCQEQGRARMAEMVEPDRPEARRSQTCHGCAVHDSMTKARPVDA